MKKIDNATAHNSIEYDNQIRKTIPYYELFHIEIVELVKASGIKPSIWLDTGCGTGTLIEMASSSFPDTCFWAADPSVSMLEIAKEKLNRLQNENIKILDTVSTQDIKTDTFQKVDIVTAVQAHHYLFRDDRKKATEICYKVLNENGMYITFENIRPFSEAGINIGKKKWVNFQISMGKDSISAENHMKRFDSEYFPITASEHLQLLKESGFRTAELFWYSNMQAGFYAIK